MRQQHTRQAAGSHSTTAPGTAAHRPTDWTQLSFGLNVPTWREEMKKKKKAQE